MNAPRAEAAKVHSVKPVIEPYAAGCSYFDERNSVLYDGPCIVTHYDDRMVVTLPKYEMVWVERRRQGVWLSGTLNGAPAMGFETDRTFYHYATEDVAVQLDIHEG